MNEIMWLGDNQLSLDIWNKKYRVKNETFEEWLDRVSGGDKEVKELIRSKKFLFGGRILSNRGTDRGAYSNCNSLGYVEDSLVDIMQANTDLALTYKAQGGQGLSLSKLRPKGTLIHHNFQSDGIIPFMEMFNITTKSISQGGNRRGALLLALDIWHKEALNFIKIKSNLTSINNANLSLEVDDKFMSIIEDYYRTGKEPIIHIKRNYEGNEIEYDVEPVKLYKEICKYSRNTAEPGILFMDRMKKYNMAQNHSTYRIECTNACVSGDTVILTDKGYIRIDNVVDQEVNIWNGYEWSIVTPTITGHDVPMYRVYLSNGNYLDCTEYHKWIIQKGYGDDSERVEAKNLKEGDKLVKFEYPIINCGEIIDEKIAYMQGFFSGDGCITKDNKCKIYLYGKKKSLISYFPDCVANDQEKENRVQLSVTKYRDNLCKDFVPGVEYSIKSRLDWLAGLIDSDGTFAEGLQISSINKEFLTKVLYMINTLGCTGKISLMRKGGEKEMPNHKDGNSVYICKDCYRLIIPKYQAIKLIDLGLNTHRVKIDTNCNREASQYLKITKIEKLDNAEIVYCFNEPINHTGVFNGIMTGQCSEIPMTKHGACLTGDTLISTFNGSKKLKDLKEEYIFGTDNKLHKYLEVKSKGTKDIYEVTFNNGLKIRGTEDHLLEEVDGNFVKIIDSFEKKIKVFTPKSNIIIGGTSSFYEMLGWIHGDGWFSTTLGISFNKKDGDYEIKDRILEEFINYFEVSTKPNRNDDIGYSIQTDCKKSIEKALQLGMHKGKANQRDLPDCFYSASDVEQRSFIRGLFSADGCISGKSNKQIKYNSNSIKLVEEIQTYLSSIGIHSSLCCTVFKTCKRPNQYSLRISKESAMRFMDIIGFLYSKKTNKFNFSKLKIYKDETYYTVTKIEKIGKEEVFDIHNVEDISTFYANGVAVHNCILSSINLKEYVENPYKSNAKIKYNELTKDISTIVRAMDDIVTENQPRHVLPGQAKVAETYRNVGIGVMGLNDLFVRMGLKYGSPESVALAGHIMKLIFRNCVLCSVALAKERGSFPGYESNIWDTDIIKNNFTEDEIKQLKEENCLRNLSLVSIAPTGSIGTMLGVSTGAESYFALSFMRRTISLDGDKEHYYKVDIDAIKEYKEITGNTEVPDFFVGANDIPWKQRVDMQAALQNSVDQAISSTINLPKTTTAEDIEQLYLYAWKKGLKGVTIFVDGSREPILSKEVKPKEITRCGSPKRPSVLPCDIYSTKVKGEIFIVCVGLYKDQPYEVFVFRPDNPDIKITNNRGTITKKAKGVYSLKSIDFDVPNILNTNITIEEKAATLYSSMLLRHGITLKYIIKTARKVNDNITSFSSAMTRILSKYLPKDTDEQCPECGEMLVRTGGCISCPSCGYSRCE